MTKRILVFFLCIGMLWVTVGSPVASARLTHLRSISMNMARSNNVVTSATRIEGQSGTTSITAQFILEMLVNGNYQRVDMWSASSTSSTLNNTRETKNCGAGTYRLRVNVMVTRNGTSEIFSESLVKAL